MQRGVWLLVLGVVAASLGVASARAAAGLTTTTAATTTDTTTTGTTTTPTTTSTTSTTTTTTTTTPSTTTETTSTSATTPAYAPLPASSLPRACVRAGAAAVLYGSGRATTIGTPASDLGPAAYRTSTGTVLAFGSSSVTGSGCNGTKLTLASVSLFDGAVTAGRVAARHGRGSVSRLTVDGASASLEAGQTVAVGNWARLTLDARVGRVSAPLVLRLLRGHDSLPAGTTVAVAFAASPQRIARPQHAPTHRSGAKAPRANRRRPPDFPSAAYPFLAGGRLDGAARDNPVTALALKYLGVPYLWGGAKPKTGFDCSGLVKYVFAQLGVDLPHFAAAQYYYADAVPVPANRLQPGDLVFFTGSDGTRKMPGHVGIYIGDGYLVDAPHTGASVQIDSLDERWFAKAYVGARKILGTSGDIRQLLAVTTPKATTPPMPLRAGASPFGFEPPAGFVNAAAAGPRAKPAGTGSYWIGGAATGGLLSILVAGVLTLRRRIFRALQRE